MNMTTKMNEQSYYAIAEYTLFYKEPVYKEPTCRRPKYLKNLYY